MHCRPGNNPAVSCSHSISKIGCLSTMSCLEIEDILLLFPIIHSVPQVLFHKSCCNLTLFPQTKRTHTPDTGCFQQVRKIIPIPNSLPVVCPEKFLHVIQSPEIEPPTEPNLQWADNCKILGQENGQVIWEKSKVSIKSVNKKHTLGS